MISTDSPILVFGAGSIGERHLNILQRLGYTNLWVYRQRHLPLLTVDPSNLLVVTTLTELDKIPFAAAIVCTPTAQHLSQTLWCVQRGIPVLVEKPLSHTPESLEELSAALAAKPTLIQVAYMLRYHFFFKKVKSLINEGELGKLLSMQTYWGEYLPDWHPWEDYRTSYAARRELGGGVTLTLSHDLDLVNWLSGSQVRSWNTIKNYRSSLEIDVESGADISVSYENGITAHCHLNFHERVPRRWYRFVFEAGSVEVDYLQASFSLMQPNKQTVSHNLENFDRNRLFEDQTADFFQKINKGNFATASWRAFDESRVILKICT